VNSPPVAVNDTYTMAEDTRLVLAAPGVLRNDRDADGDTLTVALINGTAHGSLDFKADGSFTYMPAANYNGTDGFTYLARDATHTSNIATVTLKVTPVNDPPAASSDVYVTPE